jgi:hypothetical protein
MFTASDARSAALDETAAADTADRERGGNVVAENL